MRLLVMLRLYAYICLSVSQSVSQSASQCKQLRSFSGWICRNYTYACSQFKRSLGRHQAYTSVGVTPSPRTLEHLVSARAREDGTSQRNAK